VAIELEITECSSLGDADYALMAELAESTVGLDIGVLSKHANDWVLAFRAYQNGELTGFVLSTLERIGGTPSLVLGIGTVSPTPASQSVLSALMHENFYKALMAFPDEDVLVISRINSLGGFDYFADLTDVRPWPEVRLDGEERAWARRLAKRFGSLDLDDRALTARSDEPCFPLHHDPVGSPRTDRDVGQLLSTLDSNNGQYLLAWGWAMVEFLESYQEPHS